ncbi:hypothetical protein CTI14_72530, partial [Methylobacterium radiotolerans]
RHVQPGRDQLARPVDAAPTRTSFAMATWRLVVPVRHVQPGRDQLARPVDAAPTRTSFAMATWRLVVP